MTKARRPQYAALCRRSGNWWAIDIPDVPGAFTQSRRLEHAQSMARDAIALLLDVDPLSFDVEVRVELQEHLQEAVESVARSKADALQARENAATSAEQAVRVLTAEGITIRDIGEILGVSFQRVAQLAAGRRERPASSPSPPPRSLASSSSRAAKSSKTSRTAHN